MMVLENGNQRFDLGTLDKTNDWALAGELLRLRRSAAVLAQAGAQLRRATPLLV